MIDFSDLCNTVTGDLGWEFDSQQGIIKPKSQKGILSGNLFFLLMV